MHGGMLQTMMVHLMPQEDRRSLARNQETKDTKSAAPGYAKVSIGLIRKSSSHMVGIFMH